MGKAVDRMLVVVFTLLAMSLFVMSTSFLKFW